MEYQVTYGDYSDLPKETRFSTSYGLIEVVDELYSMYLQKLMDLNHRVKILQHFCKTPDNGIYGSHTKTGVGYLKRGCV